MKQILILIVLVIGISEALLAKENLDCTVFTNRSNQCNPFGIKLIQAKQVNYDADIKKLIVSKTLPLPKKKSLKILSIPEMVEQYVRVEDSLRFKGTILEESYIKNLTNSKKEEGLYAIVGGDVLGKIAEKFGIPTKILLKNNHFDRNSTLKIGQKIKIPLSQTMIDSIKTAKYKIERGDSILSIAYKFNVEPKLLTQFNHLKATSIIREGKVLDLPLPYIMKKLEKEKKIAVEKKREEEKKRKQLEEKKKKEKKQEAALKKKKEDVLKKKKKKKQEAKAKKRKEKREKIKKRIEKKRKLNSQKRSSRIKALISKRILYVKNRKFGKNRLRVTATAYSSHRGQTDSTPFLAAWNNRLRPGMKIIAVSRDLLSRYGLRNGTRVKISGLSGYYTVRDKMNKRFRKRIDIYMGLNRRRALRWGRRSVVIHW